MVFLVCLELEETEAVDRIAVVTMHEAHLVVVAAVAATWVVAAEAAALPVLQVVREMIKVAVAVAPVVHPMLVALQTALSLRVFKPEMAK
jgi:hypothetical protein